MKHLSALTRILVCFFAAFSASSVQAQVILEDQFNAAALDTNAWTFVGGAGNGGNGNLSGITGGTQFNTLLYGGQEDGVQFVRLTLNTYNPAYPGTYFKGTEMYSRIGFGNSGAGVSQGVLRVEPSATGFEFESRFRYVNNPAFPQKAGVGAFWTYWNHGTSSDVSNPNYKSSEID